MSKKPLIPQNTKLLLEHYLQPLGRSTPTDILLITHYVYISRLLCYNRVRVDIGDRKIFPNLYAIYFAQSGAGKDRTGGLLEAAYANVRSIQTGLCDKHIDDIEQTNERYLSEQVDDGKGGKKNKFTAPQKQRYLDKHEPRSIVEVSGNGTIEGLESARIEMERAGFGSTHFSISEFVDFISSGNPTKIEAINFIKELYEEGNSLAKATKGEKHSKPVNGVPCTMLAYSSKEGIEDSQEAERTLKALVGRGFARRCIISLPDKHSYNILSPQKKQAARREAKEVLPMVRSMIDEIYQETRPYPEAGEYKTMTMTQEAEYLHLQYEEEVVEEAVNNPKKLSENECSELADRHGRAVRLSACVAIYEHPKSLVITVDDYKNAMSMIEYFATQFLKATKTQKILKSEQLYNFILNTQDKEIITKTNIYKQGIGPSGNSNQAKWLDGITEELKDFCEEQGKELHILKGKGRLVHYRIEDYIKPVAPVVEVVEADMTHKVGLSFSYQKVKAPYKNYKPVECKFSSLAGNLMKGAAYAPAFFEGGYRNGENATRHGNLWILDIDNGTTIAETKEKLKDYMALIITTRSHGKKKGDRFRVLIPSPTDFDIKHGWKRAMEKMMEHIGMAGMADPAASSDTARFYYASPKDAEVWYSEGKRLLDWKPFDVEAPVSTYQEQNTYIPTEGVVPKNAKPEAVFIDKSKKRYTWAELEYLTEGETLPVHCIFPEKHENGDRTPSAFVARHKGGSLMMNCSGCGELAFNK